MRRCLTNLQDNAVKYGRKAQVKLNQEKNRIVIRICDYGPGIPLEQMNAVFDAFFRLETSRSRDTGGTGLGLTIARNIAENNGGSLTPANDPEGGLEATVRLPLNQAADRLQTAST